MSLWRVKHNLTPFVEKSLVAVAVLAGLAVVYVAQATPLAVPLTWPVNSVPGPISLDVDSWSQARNDVYSYDYSVPPGWLTDTSDPSHVVVAQDRLALKAGFYGSALTLDLRELGLRQQVENLAAADFAGVRVATYDISVSGYSGLFVIAFENGRPARQSAYLVRGRNVLVVRGDWLDPTVFSTFVSNLKFFTP
jgi:hypothetical protein